MLENFKVFWVMNHKIIFSCNSFRSIKAGKFYG
jgi:hypothetical protein